MSVNVEVRRRVRNRWPLIFLEKPKMKVMSHYDEYIFGFNQHSDESIYVRVMKIKWNSFTENK